jgi:iron(III)-salmochelin esterase
MDRRRALAALPALALAACSSSKNDGPRREPHKEGVWKDLSFERSADAPEGGRALLYAPQGASTKPILVALHGRGESGRGLEAGARAWSKDYEIDRTRRALSKGRLDEADLLGMTNAARLSLLNASLRDEPFGDLAVVCPYVPFEAAASSESSLGFARFVTRTLLPRARAEAGCDAARERTGIDGVSMGGRMALLVGLTNPDVFAAVGALQPALRDDEGPVISAMARKAMKSHKLALRLVTSERDPFLGPVRAVAKQLAADRVPHELLVIPGTHSYEFNRGPGGAEMLLWHDRVLRGRSLSAAG